MPELQPKSMEEHRQYLYDIVRLKLFYLHLHLTERAPETGETFQDVIRNRVDIYRKTDANPGLHTPSELFFDAPAWKNMEDDAGKLYRKYAADSDRAIFEEKAFAVFKDAIDRRCERDWLDNSVISNYQCGSIKHETCLSYEDRALLGFHIGNAVRPHSFYDDPLYLPRCFRALVRVAEEIYHAKGIFTHTWLNDSARWCAQFPDEWQKNMSAPGTEPNWTYCWWGQFISGRGLLNRKNADYLREHHDYCYHPRESFCSIEAMKKHIAAVLGD